MQKEMIRDLTKDMLKELEINAVGDIFAILKHAKEVSSPDELATDSAKESEKAENVNSLVSSISLSRTKQATLVVGNCGTLKVGDELIISPEKEEIVTIDIDKKDIESQSQIYNTSKMSPSHKMYPYFTEMNKASLKMALDSPQLLQNKHKLQQLARELIHAKGYTYKKKNSRSKQFGVGGDSKRPYVSEALKVKKIKEIQEDMNDADTQMALLTRQREKHINVMQFGQAATITDQISQIRGKKRQLENELTLIQNKKKHCARQKAKTDKTDVSRIQVPKITDLLQATSATVTSVIEVIDNSGTQDKEPEASLEKTPITSENKEKDTEKRNDPFLC